MGFGDGRFEVSLAYDTSPVLPLSPFKRELFFYPFMRIIEFHHQKKMIMGVARVSIETRDVNQEEPRPYPRKKKLVVVIASSHKSYIAVPIMLVLLCIAPPIH